MDNESSDDKFEILDEHNCIHTIFNTENCENNPWQQELFGDKNVKQAGLNKKINKILHKDPLQILYEKKRQKRRTIIGIIGFVLFLAMTITGVLLGDIEGNLLPKAVRFCMECIGIG